MNSIEFKDRRLAVGAKTLSLKVAGSGTPMVLLHSLLADQSSFDPIAQVLAKTHQVFVLRLPGFGESDFVGSQLEAIADHIAQGIHLSVSRRKIQRLTCKHNAFFLELFFKFIR